MKTIFQFLLLACFGCSAVCATDLKPWTETALVFYPRFDYTYQHYNKIGSSSGSEHRTADDHFYTLGVSGCFDPWCAELEIIAADTRYRSFGFDHFRATGKYQYMNDIIGDWMSVFFGLSYSRASRIAVHDISSFHHGRNELEFILSFGREDSCYDTWVSRWWGIGIFGIADHGSPWWRAVAAWEKNMGNALFFRVFAVGLLGMGGNSLDVEDFDGYGPVKHRSVDLGVRLTKLCTCVNWHFEYKQRVYAYNYPEYAKRFQLSLVYPFAL